MKENDYFDAHCHIFTLSFALKEAKNMLHDMLHGSYPWHPATVAATKGLTLPAWSGVKDLLIQLYQLMSAALGSEEENLDFLQKEALKVMPNNNWHVVPLMMDIFYMLAYPLDKGQSVVTTKGLLTASVDETEFQQKWNETLDALKSHVIQSAPLAKSANGKIIDSFLEEIIESERSVKTTLALKSKPATVTGFYETEGFCFHLNNLVNLVAKRKSELFPFIAIDPRRPGIIDTITSGEYISNSGPFYGVKLYPRMGYHPQAAPMDALYSYCSDKNIPITFHCGKSGFPPGTDWKYAEFGNPQNFEPVIKKYPNLKIDFAHLGSCDPDHTWAQTIVNLINQYDNVYTDLSCYTVKNDLVAIKPLWDNNPKLKSRLMFGTDFDVMYFTAKITMELYFANFSNVFSPSDLTLMMHDNPIKFMNL
jgi:predicted TIM-barrel fold metal-dependent hydrolase